MDTLAVLDLHGTYLSDADEREIIERMHGDLDVADLALRTCRCGERLDGFDEYHAHLRRVLAERP